MIVVTILIIGFVLIIVLSKAMNKKVDKFQKKIGVLNNGMRSIRQGMSSREVHSLLPGFLLDRSANFEQYGFRMDLDDVKLNVYYQDDKVVDIDFNIKYKENR